MSKKEAKPESGFSLESTLLRERTPPSSSLTCFKTYKEGYSTEFMSERENKRATWKDRGHPNFYHWKLIQRTLLAEPSEL